MEKIELLSPAGDLERLKIALLYGADAVYIGGKNYSLRANANNFSIDEIKEACDFAHKNSKKVYLTLNIIFHNEDIEGVYQYIDDVVKAGIDAFIVSDLFLVSFIKKNYNVEVHISTQNSTTNYESANYLKSLGADRIVLARELSRTEISDIIKTSGMDIEVFIHGAMCTFFSGRCTLSNYFTNRDSNRGGCSQVCRFNFTLNDNQDNFSVAVKDLNMSKYIKDLIDIKVKSLKVEGRMRSIYYLATVISSYRRIIDSIYDGTLNDEFLEYENNVLNRVSNRDSSTHYFSKEASIDDQYYTGRQELSNQDFLAIVLDYDKDKKMLKVSQRNYFKVGDNATLFTPNGKMIDFIINKIYNDVGELVDCANHPEEVLYLEFNEEVPQYSMIRIKIN